MTLRPKVFSKDPDSKEQFFWDWTSWPSDVQSFVIEADEDLTITDEVEIDNVVYAWVSGGVLGQVHRVTCIATLTDGTIYPWSYDITILEK